MIATLTEFALNARSAAGVVKRSPRVAARAMRARALMRQIDDAWARAPGPSRAHTLPAELIVSLTSYRPRFETLAYTLKCLLSQTMTPDCVVLWIAPEDRAYLPDDVLALRAAGLCIETTNSLRSYTKIIPTLRAAPRAFIATADDDVYYPPTWLEELVVAYAAPHEVVCHRAHLIRLTPEGLPLAYTAWKLDVRSVDASPLLFPTGVGGVLYPPALLHEDVLDAATFQNICPFADDIWLYFMGRRNGAVYRRAGPRRDMTSWPGSQKVSLLQHNVGAMRGNDVQMTRMIERYGFPTP